MEIKYPKEYKKGNEFDTYEFGWMTCWAYALRYFELELDDVMNKAREEVTPKATEEEE